MSDSTPKPPKNKTLQTNAANVRPQQRKPFKKATNNEVRDRVEYLALELAIRPELKESEINRLMKERFNIEYRQTAEYIARAKELLLERAKISKTQAKDIAVNALLDQIRTGNATTRNAAIRLFADIFGFNAPTHLRVGDPSGKPMAAQVIAPIVQFVFPANNRERKVLPAANGNGHVIEESKR